MLNQKIEYMKTLKTIKPVQNTMENQYMPEELADWEQIQSPFSTIAAELIDNNNDNPVVVKDNFFSESSVFPPGNHEDLPISNVNQHTQEQELISLLLPSSDGGDDGVRRWIRLRLGDMQTGIFRYAGRVGKYFASNGAFRSFAWTGGGVAAVLLVLVLYRRVLLWWRRRVRIESRKESLMTLMREKDERINQLLLQIAKMNEILLARRRVPVIRV